VLDGQPIVRFESNKARALLAYLAVEADRPHYRETLAGLLWPDLTERAAHANLRNTLSRLRRAIRDRDADPSFLLVSRETIQFNRASDYWLDVQAFQDRSASHQEGAYRPGSDRPERLEQWTEAIVLYRGDFLAGLNLGGSAPFEDWLLLTRERLLRRALATLHRLVTHLAELGEYTRASEYAWRQVELAPWGESAQRQLMRVLALDGQRDAALTQYQVCCRTLRAELDIAPEAETTALYERIRDGGELPAPEVIPSHNLPAQWTPFVGREDELAEIAQLLADSTCRLLSLVGPGGSGKTRLALEAARTQLRAYEHGVYFCSLAPLQSTSALPAAIARAIGFALSGGRDPVQQLRDYVRRKRMLLVLDNCEHLLASPTSGGIEGGIARIAAAILRAAPQVTLIVTSRTRLNVPGEHLVPIDGMAYPDQTPDLCQTFDFLDRYPALDLFAQSARRVRPGFDLSTNNVEAVVQICRLVQGLPLAIMLSAAWIRILSPNEIADEIERGLDFLSTEWREVEPRHASVRALFDHSWSLLSDHERTVLAGLSIFRGGCTRQAAQQVSGASLRDLMALVDHSLLQRLSTDRFEMHELLRQYTAEKLGQLPDGGAAVRDRHSTHYATMSDRWKTELRGAQQLSALAEMDMEIEDVRAAWDWALRRGQIAQLDRQLSALWRYADSRNRQHFATWFGETARALSTLDPQATKEPRVQLNESRESDLDEPSGPRLRLLSKLLAAQSYCGRRDTVQLAQQSLSVLARPALQDRDVRAEKAFALLALALAERSERAAEQSLALYRELDDPWGIAFMLCTLCYCIPKTPANDERLQRLQQEALSIAQAAGDRGNTAHASHGLAIQALRHGQLVEAEQLGQQTLDLYQGIGDRLRAAWVYDLLGAVAMARGQFGRARAQMEQAAELYDDMGTAREVAQAAFLLGTHEMHLGQFVQARRCGERVLSLCPGSEIAQTRAHLVLGSVALVERDYAQTRRLLQGQDLTITYDQSGRHELNHLPAVLACALIGLGQPSQARRHLLRALRLVPNTQVFWPLMYSVATYALLLIEEGEAEQAVELYALASRYPFVANSSWFEAVAGKHIAAVAATLPSDVVAAAQERGRARDLDATVEELLAELGA
jgi:predicted ATPase/DNA-binding SARP family transcriptional activator